jgi:mono/diheme cytochrome c family protein
MPPRKHENTKRKWFSSCLRVFVALIGALPVFGERVGGLAIQETDRGKQTYMRVGCYQCHGREAQGASTGPRLGPDPLPLVSFTRYVRTPRSDMPPYSTRILTDAELADVYAYVSSRPRPQRVAP